MIKMYWKADYTLLTAIDANFPDAAQETIWEMAEWLANDIRSHWSSSSPSPFGGPPGVDYGYLDQGTTVDSQGRDESGRFAGADAKVAFVRVDTGDSGRSYADAVQRYSGRPFWEAAVERAMAVFPQQMKGMWDRVKR